MRRFCVAFSVAVALLFAGSGCINWDEELNTYCINGGGGCSDGGTDAGVPSLQIAEGDGQAAPAGLDFETALVVRAVNAAGAPVSGVEVTATCPAQSPTCTFDGEPSSTVITDPGGFATFEALTAGSAPGTYSVSATAAGFAAATFALTNLEPAAYEILAPEAPITSTQIMAIFPDPFSFVVLGSNGDPLAHAEVRFELPPDGATGRFTAVSSNVYVVQTDEGGVVSTGPIRAEQLVGEFDLTATVLEDGEDTGVSASLTLTVTPGPPSALVQVSGDNQVTSGGAALLRPLVVRVEDAGGNPVPGVSVTFANGDTGGHCKFSNGLTDADQITDSEGLASETCFTAPVAETFSVTALVADLPSVSTVFAVNVLIPDRVEVISAPTVTGLVNQPFPDPVTVKVFSGTRPVPNAGVTFAILGAPPPGMFPGGGVVEVARTGEDGLASSSQITPVVPGVTFLVTATETHTGPTGQGTVNFTVAPE